MIRWTDPDPVFWDCESQSAADLKEKGGRLYAADPTTRVLSAVFYVDGVYHVWVPEHVKPSKPVNVAALWPHQLGPAQPIEVWYDGFPPDVEGALLKGRTFVAHNCFGFDRFIWEQKIAPLVGGLVPAWADSIPLARTGGFRGSLDALAKQLVGGSKDSGKRIAKKYFSATVERSDDGKAHVVYPHPPAGDLEVILRYNVADVDLLRRAWQSLDGLAIEADVIDAHDAVNERGIGVDTALAGKLVAVSGESVGRAAKRIEELTGGELGAHNLRSVKQVNAWLDKNGVRVRDYTGKRTLRKDFITQALANPWMMLDDDAPATAVRYIPPEVFEVLRLRGAALRITGAKGGRAILRTSPDGRARDLFTYWQAHTGRWSSAGIQVHNLPRPRQGIPVAELLALHESGEWGTDAAAAYELIASKLPAELSVDDAVGSLLRPMFLPKPGHCFVIVDYAAIEARVLAWMAGEDDLLTAFAAGTDIYKQFGAKLFGKPADAITGGERQIAKVTVLGCGYGLGADKFRIYCALQGVDLAAAGTSAEECVEAYRAAYPAIAGRPAGTIDGKLYRKDGLWSKLNWAATDCITNGGIRTAGRTRWAYDGSTLRCELPSGRILHYRGARIEDRVPGYAAALGLDKTKPTLIYEGAYAEAALYGGKITENVDQAIARDVMATAMATCHIRYPDELPVVMTAHDEIVAEVPEAQAEESLNLLMNVMTDLPDWAAGCPIAVEGHAAPRYLKAAPAGWPSGSRKPQ